jgi:hypothetical protein
MFEEAYRAKRYQTAVAAVFPLLTRGGIMIPPEQPREDLVETPYYGEAFLNVGNRFGGRVGTSATLDQTRRATIARELADSYAKLNMPRDATFYYRIALRLDPADAESKTQLKSLQAQLELRRANRNRQPAIAVNLEQDHLVRPRLAGVQ